MTQKIKFDREYKARNINRVTTYIKPKYIKNINGEKTLFFFCTVAWHECFLGEGSMPLKSFFEKYILHE